MTNELSNVKVAILATNGFEQDELLSPRRALQEAGAEVKVISPAAGKLKGWKGGDWGDEVEVDVPLAEAESDRFDALVLPGGVINPDKLRMDPKAIAFVKAFHDAGKPIGAICHGPWLLVEADLVRGATVTAWPSIRTDLRNAGANVVDQEVVVDRNLVTSRSPDDLPAFNAKLVEVFSKSRQAKAA